jgi:hypothetical protein
VAGTPAAAVANKAKEGIAIHAAVTATPAPVQAVSTMPTLDDLARQITAMKQQRDHYNEVLAELAMLASSPSLGAVPPAVA